MSIRAMGAQSNRSRWLRFAAMFTLMTGIGVRNLAARPLSENFTTLTLQRDGAAPEITAEDRRV